ncbi:TetR/AcrR family transcriptional regulator [Streptomyces sp. NPDC023723]|uniref:TetR/AcrR family transcriptional regulator n=1 Tax=Streptomyces sp. NPDC023723 TaxID=3154323 RepID=UPI0033C9EC92
MPGARESLLDAAHKALSRQPWSAVRMVDVATSAGVSRQTLYNEFGSKEGLGRALVRREADGFLAGIERALAGPGGPCAQLTAAAEWTTSAARRSPLVRALLTGCWEPRLPAPALAAVESTSAVPAQRRADGPLPSPGEFVALVRDRAAATVSGREAAPGSGAGAGSGDGRPEQPDAVDLTRVCELAVRLALSCVAAPPGEGGVADLVRTALPRQLTH